MDYTLNMLTSLKNLGLDNKINTYCLDNDSYKEISSNGFNAEEVKIDFDIVKNPTHYGTKDFNIFMYYKVKVIKSELKNNKFVTYTDGDVVFKKTFSIDQSFNDVLKFEGFKPAKPMPVGQWWEGARAYCLKPEGAKKSINFVKTQGAMPADWCLNSGILDVVFDKSNKVTFDQKKFSFTKDLK